MKLLNNIGYNGIIGIKILYFVIKNASVKRMHGKPSTMEEVEIHSHKCCYHLLGKSRFYCITSKGRRNCKKENYDIKHLNKTPSEN